MMRADRRARGEASSADEPALSALVRALSFAAGKHRDQRRKGADAAPFINHAIEVIDLLVRDAGITDPVTLQAAVLHDTIEDTDVTAEEIEAEFGPRVREVVEEVTDDERLPAAERRRLQVERAPHLSESARLIRLADKIANVRSVAWSPPVDWTAARRHDYLGWAERVAAGCRGCSPALDRLYDAALAEGIRVLRDPPGHD